MLDQNHIPPMQSDTRQMLDNFNQGKHTIEDIWNAVGKFTPFVVKTYEDGEDVSVLVTQVINGKSYGYPLFKLHRTRNDWYTDRDTAPVKIPNAACGIWNLVDTPFDDFDKVMFRIDFHAEMEKEEDGRPSILTDPSIRRGERVTFGKYKGRTVGEVIDSDPGYAMWAITNSEMFRNISGAKLAFIAASGL